MSAQLLSSAVLSCLGDGEATFRALCEGRSGVRRLPGAEPERRGVSHAYPFFPADGGAPPFAAAEMLGACVARAVAEAGLDPTRERVSAIVGTGLRELAELERWDERGRRSFELERLHFGGVVRAVAPGIDEVITLSNACSAGGHALGLAQDMLDQDEADAVIAAATDTFSASMLAMIGRVAQTPADHLRPLDQARSGALLGEGAAALVLGHQPRAGRRPLARVLATGLCADAHHETAPALDGIRRAVDDAFRRARRGADEIDLVIAHATGTALNDPIESELLRSIYDRDPAPLVTAIKGGIGHTSGAAALMAIDVAVRCMLERRVPPIVGLREPIAEASWARLVREDACTASIRVAQVNAFGFGGVNAVTLLEAV